MKGKTWYFITDDTLNEKNKFLYSYFSVHSEDRFVLLSPKYSSINSLGFEQLTFNCPNKSNYNLFWSKISFFLSRTGNSFTNIFFPTRNIYNRFGFLVNFFWPLKMKINKYLPSFEKIFFFGIHEDNFNLSFEKNDVFIFDMVLIRSLNFSNLLKFLINKNFKLYGVLTSWDNPYYSQLFLSCDKIFVWSKYMLEELNRVHSTHFNLKNCFVIGPFPFYNFFKIKKSLVYSNERKFVGYACTYCDLQFMGYEIQLIKKLAKELSFLGFKLLVRPYPSLDINLYSGICAIENVVLYFPDDFTYFDRFGDGRERIMFSSDLERHQYLSKCFCFLSLGTSFTIEAAIHGLSIFQFNLDKSSRHEEFEKSIFERIEISDQILFFYLNQLLVVKSYSELNDVLASFCKVGFKEINFLRNKSFLDSYGFEYFEEI